MDVRSSEMDEEDVRFFGLPNVVCWHFLEGLRSSASNDALLGCCSFSSSTAIAGEKSSLHTGELRQEEKRELFVWRLPPSDCVLLGMERWIRRRAPLPSFLPLFFALPFLSVCAFLSPPPILLHLGCFPGFCVEEYVCAGKKRRWGSRFFPARDLNQPSLSLSFFASSFPLF